ncbi:MAG: 4-hydroxy-3-methylbut-2-enyl diphosphate reductase [Candidatus Stahlbacteria bacterium]|nr:MAG: 4-hydroxy-3-methylbut-2-enyl diphosphate reductase [Candidatus Stahlbacteria bacterium]
MEILLAEDMGFCFGVKRAIKIARDKRKETENNIYTLGSIIHNPQVVEKLKEEGIVPVGNLDEITNGYVVISSHGVSPLVQDDIKKRGLKSIDATCPLVKRVQEKALELVMEGYEVFVIGEKEHLEVQGIVGYTGGKIKVINPEENIEFKEKDRVGLVAQTTQTMKSLEDAILKILPKVKELKVFNTICEVTNKRQKEIKKLAKMADIIIVIGGRKSANTKRLAALAKDEGCETYHVEEVKDINEDWFLGKNKVGITAGASTPDWIIKEVIDRLNLIAKKKEGILHER